jgi:hypothetical protein
MTQKRAILPLKQNIDYFAEIFYAKDAGTKY